MAQTLTTRQKLKQLHPNVYLSQTLAHQTSDNPGTSDPDHEVNFRNVDSYPTELADTKTLTTMKTSISET